MKLIQGYTRRPNCERKDFQLTVNRKKGFVTVGKAFGTTHFLTIWAKNADIGDTIEAIYNEQYINAEVIF